MQILSPQLLEEIVQRLVEALKPEQIILFGSHAYGEPTEDSDLDLLIILSYSDEKVHRRVVNAYRALRGIMVPTDLIVLTRAEVDRKMSVLTSLVSQAVRQGRVLYG
jgi:uncharacterized protein